MCVCSLVMSMSNFRTNILEAVQVASEVFGFHFLRHGPSYDTLDLADAANATLLANSIPRKSLLSFLSPQIRVVC